MHRLYIIQVCYAVVKEHAVGRREAGMHVLLKLYDMNKTRMRHNKYTATNRSINKRPYVVNLNSALSKHRKYTHGSPYLFLLYEGGKTSWSLDQTLSICILLVVQAFRISYIITVFNHNTFPDINSRHFPHRHHSTGLCRSLTHICIPVFPLQLVCSGRQTKLNLHYWTISSFSNN